MSELLESKPGEIYALIPKVAADIGAISKDGENAQQKYKFRGIDAIYQESHRAFIKHGIFTVPRVVKIEREERLSTNKKTLLYTILTVKYTFFAPDGSFIECVTVGEAMDSGDKSCNKAMSAAHKYAILQVFTIPTEEPKDTEDETHEVEGKCCSLAEFALLMANTLTIEELQAIWVRYSKDIPKDQLEAFTAEKDIRKKELQKEGE